MSLESTRVFRLNSNQLGQKYGVILSYDGTDFCGWQKQKGTPKTSIQGTLEEAIRKMTGEQVSVVGSGRTDSGVHAIGQVGHFVLREKDWDPFILLKGLNAHLPLSIRLLQAERVPLEFHAQRSAVKKQYSYYLLQGVAPPPHLSRYVWWVRRKLDLSRMNQALSVLVGEHDFVVFQGAGATVKTTIRTLHEASATGHSSLGFPQVALGGANLIKIRLIGSGFLKQMVRSIVGTLVQVGEGYRPVEDMTRLMESKDRSAVGPTAPGRGLWLENVSYPAPFPFGKD